MEKCRKEDFGIIIMDVVMPRLDVVYAIHKEIQSKKDIPVPRAIGENEEYDKLYGFELGLMIVLSSHFL